MRVISRASTGGTSMPARKISRLCERNSTVHRASTGSQQKKLSVLTHAGHRFRAQEMLVRSDSLILHSQNLARFYVGVGIGLEIRESSRRAFSLSTNLTRLLCPWFMQRWHRKAMPSLSVVLGGLIRS
jgi:hypothetical protein